MVRQHDRVYPRKVNAQTLCVAHCHASRPGVEEDATPCMLNAQRQAEFRCQIGMALSQ